MSSSNYCTDHRETVADTSLRGKLYPDDRTALAYVHDGLSLEAICFSERAVDQYEKTSLTISLTPAGECRIEGRCRSDNGGGEE